jgi:hypothetical protein
MVKFEMKKTQVREWHQRLRIDNVRVSMVMHTRCMRTSTSMNDETVQRMRNDVRSGRGKFN